jgi:hypothetical protein
VRRWLMGLATALLLVPASVLPALAVQVFAWTLVVSPMAVLQGQSTTFSLTATNLDTVSQLGCLQVDLQTSFAIVSLGTPVASDGEVWVSSRSGNSVVVNSTTGPGRLLTGESVTFPITARPTAAGTFLWNNHAHASQNCLGTELTGVPVSITVVPAPTPNPTPTLPPTPGPTATPTPAPTPRGSQTPAPSSTSSSPPAATPTSSGSVPPADVSPTPRPGDPSSTPAASGSVRPSALAPAPSPGGAGTGGADELRVAPLDDSADGAIEDLGGLDLLALLDGPFVWFVPTAAVGVPGLLVIAWVALQAIGALAWIPAVRRMAGDDRRHRRSRPA